MATGLGWLLVLAAAAGLLGSALSRRATDPERAGALAGPLAAFVAGAWVLGACFYATRAMGLFDARAVASFLAIAAIAAWTPRRARLARLAGARAAAVDALRGLRGLTPFESVLVVGLGFVGVARIVRGLAAPPLAWDALTYHLPRAVEWIRAGRQVPDTFGGFYEAYRYFPDGGDLFWAYALSFLPDGGGIVLVGAAFVAVAAAATAGIAREIGASTSAAAGAGLVVATCPSLLSFLSSAYVDGTAAAFFLCGAYFAVRARPGSGARELVLAAAGLSLAAAVKTSFLPLALLGITASVVRSRPSARVLVAALAVSCVAAPPYVDAFRATGNPLFPFPAPFLFEARHPVLDAVHSGRGTSGAHVDPMALLRDLALPEISGSWFRSRLGTDFLNPGPSAVLLPLAALAPLLGLLRRRESRFASATLAVAGVVLVAGFASPSNRALLTLWGWVLGRHLVVALAIAAVFVAGAPWGPALLRAAALTHLVLAVPLGWCREEAAALRPSLAAGLLGFLLAALAVRRGRTGIAFAAVATLAFAGFWSLQLRRPLRSVVWRAAAEGRAWDLHRLAPELVAFTTWERLSGEAAKRVGVLAGFSHNGHNVYRFPLYGDALQHDVFGVRDRSGVGPEAWLRGLSAVRPDFLVVVPPPPREALLVRASPGTFRRMDSGAREADELYAVRPAAREP